MDTYLQGSGREEAWQSGLGFVGKAGVPDDVGPVDSPRSCAQSGLLPVRYRRVRHDRQSSDEDLFILSL